jgi:dihydroorotate dehydrogenase electron transfer subunit
MNTSNVSCSDLRVVSLNHLAQGQFYELVLEPPGWPEWRPGQFVMLRPTDWGSSPLLPRPFSIASVEADGLHILFQVVGQGTRLMSGLRPGQKVVIWGPLGNGFTTPANGRLLLLAGGMGIAPFLGLSMVHDDPELLELVFGHRVDLACYPFRRVQERIRAEAHRQETEGDIGRFIQYLGGKAAGYAQEGMILACGPEPFLKAVQGVAAGLQLPAQLSLERRMACGVGACLGCVVEKRGQGPVQSCTRGPVFFAHEIVL